ncbi:TonB-dependent receptor [Terriglobus roseus]|uniref:Carboxypeptidase regulatory-like domain-containing protein n=1 Tax=Terriglobus roseus TaxID=392734 RepID=A0A1H4PEY4_9BACT|nr:TonB-dependent receptor [Terriglobus roseus]SEC05818.1 Carboxypeptidase regulatory-like domain-containing protein [Terriglobus roseus]
MNNRYCTIFRSGQTRAAHSIACAAVTLMVLGGANMAHAQLTTADIIGTVTDASGATVPNAQVEVKNLATNETRTITSGASGEYVVSNLKPGHYSITVTASGFKVTKTGDLAVEAGDRARNDTRLELGNVSETISVEAQTPLLQSENATVSSTVTAQAVQDLPLNGRNYVQLVQLVPGANEGPGNGLTSGGRPDDRRQSSSISVNGQDDTLNNFTIDGFDNNERVIGTSGVRPNVEGMQEISVQTNSYAPEAGRTAGGVINIVTKSGGNQFHGSVYEYFRNDIFDARTFSQNTGAKPELRQNQFGGSIGGPIFKDKTFFFGDYEGLRQVIGVTYKSTVPTIDEYNNINSIGGGSPQALVAAGAGTAGRPIDPIALNYLKLFPAPNEPGLTNNYIVSPSKTATSNLFDVRIDHHFNANNLFFGRYTYNKVDSTIPPALGTRNGLDISGGRYIFAGPASDAAQQYAFDYTHIFSQNLLVDLKAGYTRINNLSLPLNYGKNAATQVGFGPNMNFNATSNVLPPISFGPFADIGDGAYVPLQDIDSTFQYAAIVNWTKGNHNLKFGASYIRRQARNLQSAFPGGQYGFNLISDNVSSTQIPDANARQKKQQDNQLASSLVGAFSSEGRNYNLNTPDYRTYEPSFFIQDSWKAMPNLTVLYGVRYDLFTPFTEAHGHISNFDFNQALTLTSATVGQALKIPGVNGVDGHAGIGVDHSNFAPRIGFSYSPNARTVLRGGYGLSFFPGNYTSNADLKNAPFVSVYSPNCVSSVGYQIQRQQGVAASASNPDCATVAGAVPTFDAGLPLPAAQTINSPALSFTAESPNFRSAMIQQFNLQVQQQFGANVLTVGYVGNIGQHLPQTISDINVPKPGNSVNGGASSARPLSTILPNLGGVSWIISEGVSNYSALQVSFQRRFVHGLSFDGNYTWGRAANDVTGFSQEGAQGAYNADPTRIRLIDYGLAENDIKNRFALSLNYAILEGHHFSNAFETFALGGWQVNTITVWQGGKPVSILNSSSASLPGDSGYNNRATPINNGGTDRPNQIASPGLGSPTNSRYFNTAAFVPQPLGTIGTTQRNNVFGPHFRHVDLSLFKDFRVTERTKVQFRAESFNISNTPSYQLTQGSGNVQLGNSAFGTVTDADSNYTPRLFQFALKLNF